MPIKLYTILLVNLMALLLLPTKVISQVIDNFNDGNFTNNPEWLGDDSLFTVNSNFELQSRGTTGTSKDIQLATESSVLLNTEFSIVARFNLNPSSQNFSRFYLSADSLNLKGNINGYYIQFGGHTGTSDSIVLFKQTGTVRTAILSSRPGTVGKNSNIVRIKVLVDAFGEFSLFTDTTGNFDYIFEGKFKDLTPHINGIFSGVFVKFTSSNILNYFFDDVYIGAERIDKEAPFISSFQVSNDSTIVIQYNERLYTGAANINRFLINGNKPKQAAFSNQNQSAIRLTLNPLNNGSENIFEIFAMQDINGNVANDTLFRFIYFEPIENDIVISELMPDPDPPVNLPNAEYIELYNNSAYEINLEGWTLSDPGATATLGNVIIKPDSFLIICSSAQTDNFRTYGKVFGVSNFPTLNNSDDILTLKNKNGKIIHFLSYTTENYNNPSKSNGGFSMELINPNQVCKGVKNWLASEHPNGGTPGTVNTIFRKDIDVTPPEIIYNDFVDSINFIIILNEPLLQNSLLTFSITNNTIDFYRISNDSIYIRFLLPFEPNKVANFSITNVADCIGNTKIYTINKIFIPAEIPFQNDLIVSEILHSPSTATNMPNEEYVELYNKSKKAINLKNCVFADNTGRALLPEYKLYPDSFVVLCNINKLNAFKNIRNLIGVKSLPTLSSSDKVVIYNSLGYLVHAVEYSSNWHRDGFKQSVGGYSLEIINTNNPCAGAYNWKASEHPSGGTPGFKNSVSSENTDNIKPVYQRIYPSEENKIRLYFNETLDSLSIEPIKIKINEQISSVLNWRFLNDKYNAFEITLSSPLNKDETYTILIEGIKDCVGNEMVKDNDQFALMYKPDSGDIVINEVLFHPKSGGSDFVELHNLTNKFIDLKPLLFANTNSDNEISTIRNIATEGYMLKPKDFVAITDNPDFLASNYTIKNPKNIFYNTLPSMNNTGGSIILLDSMNTRFDALFYTDKMHHPLLTNKAGVSLEKVNPFISSAIEGNWQSASAASGFATPGYQNSQFFTGNSGVRTKYLHITPEIFSPSTGNSQVIEFKILLPEPGYQLNLDIINSSGQQIAKLIGFANAGTENTLYWNGITQNNEKATIGIYIAYIEAIHPNGNKIAEKQTFVIGQ